MPLMFMHETQEPAITLELAFVTMSMGKTFSWLVKLREPKKLHALTGLDRQSSETEKFLSYLVFCRFACLVVHPIKIWKTFLERYTNPIYHISGLKSNYSKKILYNSFIPFESLFYLI